MICKYRLVARPDHSLRWLIELLLLEFHKWRADSLSYGHSQQPGGNLSLRNQRSRKSRMSQRSLWELQTQTWILVYLTLLTKTTMMTMMMRVQRKKIDHRRNRDTIGLVFPLLVFTWAYVPWVAVVSWPVSLGFYSSLHASVVSIWARMPLFWSLCILLLVNENCISFFWNFV